MARKVSLYYANINKKKIGAKGGTCNVPDGYLIDLSGQTPRLYVVENELAAHDPLRHIAVQILQFSLSFEAEPLAVKKVLLAALSSQPSAEARCEAYAVKHGFRNLDHLMEQLVFETPFAALVVIDEVPENLEIVLAQKFRFGVEVLQLTRFRNEKGECIYHFEPFLADLAEDTGSEPRAKGEAIDPAELDTVVVPARDEGFHEIFLGQSRWHAVRLHGSMRPQIKYLAVYRVAPVSAITHVATVKSIEPWKDTGKFVLEFSEPPKEIPHVPMAKGGHVQSFQSLRYTSFSAFVADLIGNLRRSFDGYDDAATAGALKLLADLRYQPRLRAEATRLEFYGPNYLELSRAGEATLGPLEKAVGSSERTRMRLAEIRYWSGRPVPVRLPAHVTVETVRTIQQGVPVGLNLVDQEHLCYRLSDAVGRAMLGFEVVGYQELNITNGNSAPIESPRAWLKRSRDGQVEASLWAEYAFGWDPQGRQASAFEPAEPLVTRRSGHSIKAAQLGHVPVPAAPFFNEPKSLLHDTVRFPGHKT